VSAFTIAVIAKAPRAGRSKTRLCPPCTPEQASALAEACLRDTLDAVRATMCARRVLVLDGPPGAWADGFEVIEQRGDGLGERIANAFDDVGGPTVLVGMDTPQLTPRLLEQAAGVLTDPGTQAVLGPARDGGYWAIGLREPNPAVLEDVPMSVAETFAIQLARLNRLGLATHVLPPLRDIDTINDAYSVAAAAPATRLARRLDQLALA